MSTKKAYTKNLEEEFKTVDLLINSESTTGRTDAFILAWVKSDKQIRRIFTYLIYQFPAFSGKDILNIIRIIASKRYLDFWPLINKFNAVYHKRFQEIVGRGFDDFQIERERLRAYRNKILHGQLTGQNLTASQLTNKVSLIREWCTLVAEKFTIEIGYDGLGRGAFRKSKGKDLTSKFKIQINSTGELDSFIDKHMRQRA